METALFKGIRKEILNELDNTQVTIRAAIAWFTNQQLFDKLCEKIKAGKKVELIVIDDFINCGDWGLNFQHFINLGGHLYYGDPNHPMHHKFCVIDDHTLFNGSYNWTYYAESKNVENTIKIKDHPSLIKQFIAEFDALKERLKPSTVAIKRSFQNLDLVDFFAVRNYLAYDLFANGQQNQSIQYVKAAVQILPQNAVFQKAYQQLTQEKIKKKTTATLGIESRINGVDGKFSIHIPNGTSVPFQNSRKYYTVFNNQTSMEIKTYRGENEDCINNVELGLILIKDLPKLPAGQANVTVTFTVNEAGDLRVQARNNHTGGEMEAVYQAKSLLY